MTKKIVTLSESQLSDLIKRAINEADNETENYMTFSNLQQMKRQIDMLLELDENVVDQIIQNGHDWADDHISVAKENLDQVFDFMMNETKKSNEYIDYEDITEGRKKTGTKLCARGKSAAKSKFKVYPSAYANGYAVQVCKGKIKGLDGKKQCSGTYC
jgi:sugar-specific transcriptional regulator TrmB